MKIEKQILNLVKENNPTLEIAGLRGLVKSGENQWSFRYTFRDGDFLSVSKLLKIKFEGIKKIPIFIVEARPKKTTAKTVKQK